MSRSMYYALPLPLSAPSMAARLAGFGLLRVPEGLDIESATVKKIMLCKFAQHALINPAFLFRQDIDPNNLRGGSTALEFIKQVNEQVRPQSSDDILVTFASRHLSAYNAMLLQNFFVPDVMDRFNYVVDLKTALETCYYFGNTKVKKSKSLNQAAKELGFTGDLSNQMQRIDALFFIYNYLVNNDPKIMTFLHGSRAMRFAQQTPGKFLVHVNEQGKLCLLKVLNQSDDRRLLKVLLSDGSSVKLHTINVDLAPLLAPQGILTPQRQAELNFNLAQEEERLNSINFADLLGEGMTPSASIASSGTAAHASTDAAAASASTSTDAAGASASSAASASTAASARAVAAHGVGAASHIIKPAPDALAPSDDEESLKAYRIAAAIYEKDLPFYDLYFRKLSEHERNIFNRMSSHDIRQETNITHIADPMTKFGQQVLCYLVENFSKAVFDGQINQYRSYVEHTVNKRASSLKSEITVLFNSIDLEDAKAVALFNRIAGFF